MEKISFQPVYSEGTTILSGRRGVVQTLAQCAAHRVKTPGCRAIELWHKYNWNC